VEVLWARGSRPVSTAQHSTSQHSTAQHSTAQHSTAQRSAPQHSKSWHCICDSYHGMGMSMSTSYEHET
jgi:hypothetical protein